MCIFIAVLHLNFTTGSIGFATLRINTELPYSKRSIINMFSNIMKILQGKKVTACVPIIIKGYSMCTNNYKRLQHVYQ